SNPDGTLSVTFPNVCTTTTSTFIVRSVYGQWDNPNADIIGTDTVNIRISTTAAPMTEAVTPAPCGNNTTGVITISSPVGPNVTYSATNGAITINQASPVFTLGAGTYTITATDNNTGCQTVKTVIINVQTTLSATATPTNAACPGSATGSITVTPSQGTAPYTYSLNGGTLGSNNIFSNLTPGDYEIDVRDNFGCTFSLSITVGANSGFTATTATTLTSCAGAANGSITVTPTGGTSPFNYTLGAVTQPSNTFSGVLGGTYNILVADAAGCSFNVTATVNDGVSFTTTATTTNAACLGSATGSITVTPPTNGNAPYQYKLDTAATSAFQVGNTFNGLASGTYNLVVKDASGCLFNLTATVADNTGATATAATTNSACAAAATGTITITPVLGTSPFQYSNDNGTSFVNSATFNGLASGTYPLVVKDANGCLFNLNATVANDAGSSATATATNSACAVASTGTITITATQGTSPFQYSNDNGTTFVNTATFNGLASGTYNLAVKDANGCVYNFTKTVVNDPGSSGTAVATNSACAVASTGTITITATQGTSPFQYSNDNGTTFQNTATFTGLASGTYNLAIKDANGCVYNFTKAVGNDPGSSATATSTNSACAVAATGSITITTTQGTSPFQYSNDNGTSFVNTATFTGLAAGTYNLAVKDVNGCVFNFTKTVGNDPGSSATATSTNSACAVAATGSITITATAGTSPFQYSNDNGTTYQNTATFSGLASGTYNLAVKDVNGCVYNFTKAVGNDPGTNATATSVNSACAAAATGSITITPTAGTSPYQFSKDDGLTYQNAATFTGLASGTYLLAVKDVNGCVFKFSKAVGNDIGATATASSTNAACITSNTGTISISAVLGTSPFQYSNDNGATFQLGNSFSNLLPGSYNLAIKDVNGCVFNFTQSVGNDIGTTATAATVNAACSGSATGKIIITPVLGTAPFQYSIDNGTTYFVTDTFPGLPSGIYNLAVKDVNGCTVNLNTTINNSPGSSATARTVNSACAAAATGKIIVTPGIGTAPFRYSLDNVTYQTNDTFPNLASGTYTVYVLDANNCAYNFSATVGNDPGVRAINRTLNAACSGAATGTIIATPTLGTAPFEFLVDTATANTYQSSNIFRNMAAGTYDVTVRDANLCTFLMTATVSNNVGVRADTLIDKASCAIIPNGKITIIPTAGIAPFSYQLNGGAFQTSNEFDQLFSGNFTVVVKDSAACTLTLNITVGNAARVVIDSVNIVRPTCNGLTNGTIAIYPRLGVPPYRYSINSSSWQNSNIFNNRGASASDTIRIMDNSGCVKDTIITVTEPAALTIATSSVQATCTGNPDGSITVTSTGGTLPYEYTLNPTGNSGYQTNPVFPLVIGNYTLTTRDAKGCKTSTTQAVTLNDTMRLELGNDTTLCIGKTITFNTQTNNETTVFHWTPSLYLNDTLFKNPTAAAADTIKYYLEARWGICTRKDSITVNVLLKPIAFAGNDTAVCFKTPAYLHGSVGKVSGPVTYLWAPPTFLSATNTPDVTANIDTTGSYRYFLTVKDNYGCGFTSTDSVRVTMQPLVPAFAGNDTNAIQNHPHQLKATGGVSYSWWPIGPLNNANIANPLATISQNTNFIVTVTDVAGCVGQDTVLLRAYRGPNYLCPNAFSPNGDGNNDRFRALPVGIRSTAYFRIFNRYGELMFETSTWEGQFLKGWDGMYKGKPQLGGAYVWTAKGVDETGKEVLQSGTVVLVR
ncbi:MAG: hypothetical protein RLY16_887, partial [Bacteroidota bacterium]